VKITFKEAIRFLQRYSFVWSSIDGLMELKCYDSENRRPAYLRLYDPHTDYDQFIMEDDNKTVYVKHGRILEFVQRDPAYNPVLMKSVEIIPLKEVMYENHV